MQCECHVRSLTQSGSAVSELTVDEPDAVLCTSEYSSEIPYTMGSVVFALTNERYSPNSTYVTSRHDKHGVSWASRTS